MPRRPMRPNEVSSGGVVFRRSADQVEVCLVNDGRYWGFPKGLIEPGETPEVAALREISEETGLVREVLLLKAALPLTEYVYRRRDSGSLIFKRVHHFLVEAPAGAELHPDPAEINVVKQQLASMDSKCKPNAPLYRQITLVGQSKRRASPGAERAWDGGEEEEDGSGARKDYP